MSKTKIALGIIVAVCIVIVIFWIYGQPQGRPEFEIVDFELVEEPFPYEPKRYQVVFKLKNLGTADATGIHGTLKLGSWNKTWQLYPEDSVLKPGETSSWIVTFGWYFIGVNPAELTAIVVVECNEGVTQQLTESLAT